MRVNINNQDYQLHEGQTIKQLIKQFKIDASSGMALAVNESIIPKSQWETYKLQNNDKLILIQATQGG